MIFLHIPKTAGTSFRLGASAYFGPKYEVRDYGEKVKATSRLVKKYIYERGDYETFRKEIDNRQIKFITGHYRSEKYLPYFDKGTFVTFVRDPIQRMVSEYKHAVRVNGFKGSLERFCQRPHNIDRQWASIKSIGIDNMAFIGLTEHYEQSLETINAIFNTQIPLLERNIGKRAIDAWHPVNKDDADMIEALNQADRKLYTSVQKRFDQCNRQNTTMKSDRYVGRVGGVKKNGDIFGWAVNQTREVPVEIAIFVNDLLVGHAVANRYRPDLKAAGVKRSGCAGICFNIDPRAVKAGGSITFCVKATGEVLGRTVVTEEMGR